VKDTKFALQFVDVLTDIAYAIGVMRDGRMHQTTVRFGPDLWEALEEECARLGVSAAQYVRESTLARLAFTAGRSGAGRGYESALVAAGAAPLEAAGAYRGGAETRLAATLLEAAQAATAATALDMSAVGAQGHLARARAREIRAQSEQLRAVHKATGRRG
jgi:hypothetical protein